MSNMRMDARFENALQSYEEDDIATQAIEELREMMLHKGAKDTSNWDGIHYNGAGEVELVQVYVGDEAITVRKETGVPPKTFERLAREGRILYDRTQNSES